MKKFKIFILATALILQFLSTSPGSSVFPQSNIWLQNNMQNSDQFYFVRQDSNLNRLVATEKAFAQMAKDKTVKQAFLEFLADDAIVFEPTAVNAKTFWAARPESSSLLSWDPVWADISSDGKMGYTTGDWEFRPKGENDDPVAFGQYITVWKIQPAGKFKAILDIGISHKKPETAEKNWRAPEATGESKSKTEMKNSPRLTAGSIEKAFAKDVRLYREGKFPFVGKESAEREIKGERAAIKSSRVLLEKCESNDDLSFCYGEIERSMKDGSKEAGNSLRISKFRNGKWQTVLELYSPIRDK